MHQTLSNFMNNPLFFYALLSCLTTSALSGCGAGGAPLPPPTRPVAATETPATTAANAAATPSATDVTGRGFPALAPWVSCYGSAKDMGELDKVAQTFRIINVDVDPDIGNFTKAQITQLKNSGRNRVISYLNVGSTETFRSYWKKVPAGFVAAGANKAAHVGAYGGYPDETWMDLGNADYQKLLLDYVAPRLVEQGIDGFFMDNFEIVEHEPNEKNGACSASCRQGGLDFVRKLREKYPNLLIVMQNATSDVTRLGKTGGVAFPSLLDGISHEEVYSTKTDKSSEKELLDWKALDLKPGGRNFWIATEDYVSKASNVKKAREVYAKSRANGFSPYVADESGKQQKVFYWGF